jgi:hypothetical protein
MADQSILFLAKDVRARTLALIEGLSDAEARTAAPGLVNTILWHAGHALMLGDHLGIMLLTGSQKPSYPDGWFEKFGWKSDPRQVTTWPTISEVREQLERQSAKRLELLERADEATLSKPDAKGRPMRYLIVHGLHDEAIQQGEIYVIKKIVRAGGTKNDQ